MLDLIFIIDELVSSPEELSIISQKKIRRAHPDAPLVSLLAAPMLTNMCSVVHRTC